MSEISPHHPGAHYAPAAPGEPMINRIIATGVAILAAASLSACSGPASATSPTSAPVSTQVTPTAATSAPSAISTGTAMDAAASAAASSDPRLNGPTATGATPPPGVGGARAGTGENPVDYNVRTAVAALEKRDKQTAARYMTPLESQWLLQPGIAGIPNLDMVPECSFGNRIALTPAQEANIKSLVHASMTGGVQVVPTAYPMLCPAQNFVLFAMTDPTTHLIVELNYEANQYVAPYGVAPKYGH